MNDRQSHDTTTCSCRGRHGARAGGRGPGKSNVDPLHKYTWGENIGWTNWRDAGDAEVSQGVRLYGTLFSGFIWCENVGWINVGDGTPANGTFYQNAVVDGSLDFGVNLGDVGPNHPSGCAWGENIGWRGAAMMPPRTGRAWTAQPAGCAATYGWRNAGWLNLDHGAHYAGFMLSARATGTPTAC